MREPAEHTGDWVCEDLLGALRTRSRAVLGVWGNNDGSGLRARLPQAGMRLLSPGSCTDRRPATLLQLPHGHRR